MFRIILVSCMSVTCIKAILDVNRYDRCTITSKNGDRVMEIPNGCVEGGIIFETQMDAIDLVFINPELKSTKMCIQFNGYQLTIRDPMSAIERADWRDWRDWRDWSENCEKNSGETPCDILKCTEPLAENTIWVVIQAKTTTIFGESTLKYKLITN